MTLEAQSDLWSSAGIGEVSEAALVRDILYVFQGIDGKFIKMSGQENCYKIDSKVCEPTLSPAQLITYSSVHRMAHVGSSMYSSDHGVNSRMFTHSP